MRNTYILTLLLFASFIQAQNTELSNSFETGYYIFQLNDEQADIIYRFGLKHISDDFFDQAYKIFKTRKAYYAFNKDSLPLGHYLIANPIENNLSIQLFSSDNCTMTIVDNKTDLLLQFRDKNNDLLLNNEVKLDTKIMPFDKKTKSFRLAKSTSGGIVMIEHMGHYNYFKIGETNYTNFGTFLMRYSAVKWISYPFRVMYFSSKNMYYNITQRNLNYAVRRFNQSLQQKFRRAKAKLCPEEYVKSTYSVLSKPKYKMADTLKFNAFLLNRKNHYYKDSILVYIQGYGIDKEHKFQTKLLSKIVPTNPGSYNFELALGKDLELLLDSNYKIILRSLTHQHITTNQFRYEQYELSALRLEISNQNTKHNRWKEYEWEIQSIDENQLPILDGELHLQCHLRHATNYHDPYVYLPYQLLDTVINADPSGTTRFKIDTSIFPAADFTYLLKVTLENEEGKEKSTQKEFQYKSINENLKFHLIGDSLSLTFLDEGIEKLVFGQLNIQLPLELKTVKFNTNQKLHIDPLIDAYSFLINDKHYRLDLNDYPDLLQFQHTINKDSLSIISSNPRKIAFSYFLYKNDIEIQRGYGTELKLKKTSPGKHNYTLMVQYKWGSQISNQNILFTNERNQLNLDIQHQDNIYPGEEVDIKIKVTDFDGKPVKSLNLLTHGLTDKFNFTPTPIMPFKEKKKYKKIYSEYRKNSFHKTSNRYFNYQQWNQIAKLDEIEYYRFLYPGDSIYRNDMPVEDSVTQVMPFIFNNGHTESPQIVYIDYKPVYFSWSNHKNPYSFEINEGIHRIKIRTQNHEIELPRVEIRKGVKNIISVDISKKPKGIIIRKMKSQLSDLEKHSVYPFLVTIDGSMNNNGKAFISNKDTSQFFTLPNRAGNILLGPIKNKYLNYHDGENFSIPFVNEVNYSFFFQTQLVKMKSLDMYGKHPRIYPEWLRTKFRKNINDIVFTKTQFEKEIEERTNQYITNYMINRTKEKLRKGKNRLIVNHQYTNNISKTILFNIDNAREIELYQHDVRQFDQLPDGKYGLIYVNKSQVAYVYDSLIVQNNGINYFDLSEHQCSIQDSFGTDLIQMIFEIYDTLSKDHSQIDSFKYRLRGEINEFISHEGPINHFYGKIVDEYDDPIVGAIIQAKLSNQNAVSDFDGNFKIAIANEGDEITVRYIGLETFKKHVNTLDNRVTWTMIESSAILEDVIVKAYRVPLIDFDQTSSVQTVTAEAIANSPLKSVNALAAVSAGVSSEYESISVRGSRSNATNYYVDGIRVNDYSRLPDKNSIASIRHITGVEAQSTYGSKEVYLISTIQKLDPNRGSSLRSNFSDVGFWKPNIITDKNGEATINVTFPDDITKWNLHFYAATNTKKTGQKTTFIRSYKPLSSSLKTPKFLIKDDYSKLITKVQNYQSDSTFVESTFSINDSLVKSHKHWVNSISIDSLEVKANELDTIQARFSIETTTSYKDGEQHEIPVLPKGMLKTEGIYELLQSGQKWKINTDTFKSDMTVYVESNQMELIRGQIKHIKNYEHLCNEQLASKLLALLIEKKYCIILDEEFKYEEQILEIIKHLKKRFSPKTYWGWWSENDYIPWISKHVSKVLLLAIDMGYEVDIKFQNNLYFLSSQFSLSEDVSNKLDILEMMHSIDTSMNINSYMERLDTFKNQSFRDSLRITLWKVQNNREVDLSFIDQHWDKSMLGPYSIRYRNRSQYYHISNNNVMYTILTFKILHALDPIKYKKELDGMSIFLMGCKINGYFRNTFEGILIIDLLSQLNLNKDFNINAKPTLLISGSIQDTITAFPFKMKVKKGADISITNKALGPMFFTSYSKYWEDKIAKREDEFIIQTSLANQVTDSILLTRKEKIDLKTSVTCEKSAEYVMIEIPIPAGASYHRKARGGGYEVHREYYDHKVLIFCKYLPKGTHHFTVELKSNYGGKYTMNPAKVELMYFPTFYGNTSIKEVTIK